MASYARPCLCFFFLLLLSLANQTQARESKFFSKFSRFLTNKNSKETTETIALAPTSLPTSAPAPAPEAIEHGYGLYGDEDTSYQYPPTTTDPVKTTSFVAEEKYTPAEELANNKFHVNGKQGMSDTRFLENGKYHYDVSQEGKGENTHFNEERQGKENGYAAEEHELVEDDETYPENEENEYRSEMEELSDTRFMENGKDFHDENSHFNEHGNGNEYETTMHKDEFQPESTRFENGNGNEYEMPKDEFHPENTKFEGGNGKEYGNEKHGMSDTRFLEKGKYFYDLNGEVANAKEEDVHYNLNNDEDKHYQMEKQGLSDTRFLENGKYYYDVKQENGNANSKYNNENYKSTMNYEYANNGYNGENENEHYNSNNGYVAAGTRASYDNNYGNTKKLPNTYDSIEEYEKEEEYKANQRAQNAFVP